MEFYFFQMVLTIILVTVTRIGAIASIKWILALVKRWFGYMVEKREPISQDNEELADVDASASLPSSSAESSPQWKHDVFLSFRGEDTRKGITAELYDRLQNRRGIKTFMDDKDLHVGDVISPMLLTAIKESRFAIIVLSPNYASSTWCLEELRNICECMEDNNRVLPLFYNVDPADVRHQKKSYGDAFTKHENSGRHREKLQQWRDALNRVANIAGWLTQDYKTDSELIDIIVESVSRKVHLPEIDSKGDFQEFKAIRQAMDEVLKKLEDGQVTVVGVYGMGGVGKTTMVKQVGARAQKCGHFNEVIIAVVSQNPDLRKIQLTFADKGYSAISLMNSKFCELPQELVCPNLQILLLQHNHYLNEIPESFFSSQKELRVLDLSYTSISILPLSIRSLTNLQALYLDSCDNIIDISILGKLTKLEILSMRDIGLEELPREIGQLTNLRMLDVSTVYCDVVTIPSQVISKLYSLEELYMQCVFWDCRSKVEGEGKETNIGFDELIGLSNLSILKVCISDANCIPKSVKVVPKWVYFDISIFSGRFRWEAYLDFEYGHNCRSLSLQETDTTISTFPVWFINVVVKNTEMLFYKKCKGLSNILVEYDHGRLHGLKVLSIIGRSKNLNELMNAVTCVPDKPVFDERSSSWSSSSSSWSRSSRSSWIGGRGRGGRVGCRTGKFCSNGSSVSFTIGRPCIECHVLERVIEARRETLNNKKAIFSKLKKTQLWKCYY